MSLDETHRASTVCTNWVLKSFKPVSKRMTHDPPRPPPPPPAPHFLLQPLQNPTFNKHILLRTSPPSLGRDTLGLGTLGRLWGWALQGDFGVGHSRETLGLGTPGRLWDWETLGLGTPVKLWGWALLGWVLQGQSGIGHPRHTRALHGHSGLGTLG